MTTDNPILRARELGQSIWLDNLGRELIGSGRLAQMVRHDGLAGVTSNPAIFEKAIAGGERYDQTIRELVHAGVNDTDTIYRRLVVADVQAAADILRPVYEASAMADGYVSLEVSPDMAHDSAGTLREARLLAAAVDRPNLMIKVPATPAGYAAIERLLGEGISVNATLIFSVQAYGAVAQAYQAGVERFVAGGGDARRLASVASFFVSRVDSAVDALLQRRIDNGTEAPDAARCRALLGQAAIANARVAYGQFRRLLDAPRWQVLREAGARPQRLLWASTATKNPAYGSTYYADALVGPDTVDTLPEATYLEFLQHGRPQAGLSEGAAVAAQDVIDALAAVGIRMEDVTDQLLREGVQAFADAQHRLLAAIERKRLACAENTSPA